MYLEIERERENLRRIKVTGEFYDGQKVEQIAIISRIIFDTLDTYYKGVNFYIRVNAYDNTLHVDTYNPKHLKPNFDFLFSIKDNRYGYYPNEERTREAAEKLKPYMIEIYNIMNDKTIIARLKE